jgi:hypothetical protein
MFVLYFFMHSGNVSGQAVIPVRVVTGAAYKSDSLIHANL